MVVRMMTTNEDSDGDAYDDNEVLNDDQDQDGDDNETHQQNVVNLNITKLIILFLIYFLTKIYIKIKYYF